MDMQGAIYCLSHSELSIFKEPYLSTGIENSDEINVLSKRAGNTSLKHYC